MRRDEFCWYIWVLFPPLQHGSKVFAYFYGMFNIYVLLLAFCYTPAGAMYGDINTNENVRYLKLLRVDYSCVYVVPECVGCPMSTSSLFMPFVRSQLVLSNVPVHPYSWILWFELPGGDDRRRKSQRGPGWRQVRWHGLHNCGVKQQAYDVVNVPVLPVTKRGSIYRVTNMFSHPMARNTTAVSRCAGPLMFNIAFRRPGLCTIQMFQSGCIREIWHWGGASGEKHWLTLNL